MHVQEFKKMVHGLCNLLANFSEKNNLKKHSIGEIQEESVNLGKGIIRAI